MISLPTGTHIWIAAGVTDLWRGFDGLRRALQTVLEKAPFSGHVFVFRGRRGDLLKVLWWDSDGLCLLAKRLERRTFCVAGIARRNIALRCIAPVREPSSHKKRIAEIFILRSYSRYEMLVCFKPF